MAKSKLTPEIRSKIEEIAALDGTVEEMAYYCGISRQTIYNYLDKESPFFDAQLAEDVERLRAQPVLKARRTIEGALQDPNHAFKYLERKRRKEFGTNIDVTTDGQPLQINVIKYDGD
jgi:hypothetical protein